MSPVKKFIPALATGGVLAALGITAAPMLPVWLTPDASPSPVMLSDSKEIVVDLRDNASDADVRDIDRQFHIDLKPNSIEANADRVYVAQVPAGTDEATLVNSLRSDGRVEAAEPDLLFSIPEQGLAAGTPMQSAPGRELVAAVPDPTVTEEAPNYVSEVPPTGPVCAGFSSGSNGWTPFFVPNDPRYGEQWNFQMIGVESAWKRTRGKGAVVAVIDTGVSIGPSKKGKACRDFNTTAYTKGYDFVNKDADPYDDHAHGTHVAGTIAESTNNGEGVAGIAFDATIMPLKVLSASGSGTAADIADAIRYAADNGANVINMSLGSPYPSDVIHNACKYAYKKGVTIVCAAGNGFGEPVGYPAAFKECIAVSSVGPSGKIAKYSSYGKQVALAAPGGDMMDSGNPADGILQNTNYPESQGGRGDDYYAFQGTSMASPHVAGVAALIVSQGETDPARVRDILVKSAVPNGDPIKYGAGILSAANATAKATEAHALKLRHLLAVGLGLMFLTVGPLRRRSFGLRALMAGGFIVGMFGPDWFAGRVGADSAWNLLTFSALLPMLAYVALRRGPAVKVAGTLALGAALCLFANWHNDTLPFTTATFGETPLPWTMANLGAALAVGCASAWRAFRASNARR